MEPTIDILSWNILHGGGTRLPKIIDAINTINPEIIAFCEFKNNGKGKLLIANLVKLGYHHIFLTRALDTENTVCIISKLPGKIQLHVESDPNYPHCLISCDFGTFELYSIYLPHKKKHRLFDYLLEKCHSAIKPLIFTGDFNTGINGVDQIGNSFMYEKEYKKMLDSGLVDGYRLLHKEKKVYSWYSPQGNGYRYDHTLMSKELSSFLKSFDYIELLREHKLSDHAPMYLRIGF